MNRNRLQHKNNCRLGILLTGAENVCILHRVHTGSEAYPYAIVVSLRGNKMAER